MNLSKEQISLLERLETDPHKGLTTDQASGRRERDGVFNVVDPPVKCPAWVCCLLPCIGNLASMKAFAQIQPEDAEVLRNGAWIRYDTTSLVVGDILRLEEGDMVPADCVVLQLMPAEHVHGRDLLVDHRSVTGEDKPRVATRIHLQGGTDDNVTNNSNTQTTTTMVTTATQLYWGAHVVQGSALTVVTAIGPNTLVARAIREKRFPITTTDHLALGLAGSHYNEILGGGTVASYTDEAGGGEVGGISLISRNSSSSSRLAV